MWTRSAKNPTTGMFTVECTDWNGALFFKGEFVSAAEAEKAGTDAERRMTLAMQAPADLPTFDDIFAEMADDELLRALYEG